MTKKTAKKKLVIKKVVKTSKGVIVTDNQVKILEMVYGGCEVGKSYKLMGYFSYTDKPHLSIFRESDDRRLSKTDISRALLTSLLNKGLITRKFPAASELEAKLEIKTFYVLSSEGLSLCQKLFDAQVVTKTA